MTTQIVLAVLASTGLGAIIAAIITGLFSKRKLGAEATEIITKAAAGVVTNLREEVERGAKAREHDRAEFEEAMARQERLVAAMAEAHVKEREEWKRVLQLHVAWDSIAIAKVAELGVQLPPSPPLLPPRHYTDERGYPTAPVVD